MEAGAELEQRADPAADVDAADGRLDDPGDDAEQRALARAVAADERRARCPARRANETSRSAHTSAGPVRAAQKHEALQRARAARVDAEARATARSTGSHPGARAPSSCSTSDASARTNSRSAFGISIRLQRHSELARPVLRLDVDVPADLEVVRDEADRAHEHVAHAARVEVVEVVEDVRAEPRLAGRRLALVGERPLAELRALRDRRARLEELLLVRIAVARGCAPAASAR